MAETVFGNLTVDLDDDVYWFSQKEDRIQIWEVYRIHPSFQLTVSHYANWLPTLIKVSLNLQFLEKIIFC